MIRFDCTELSIPGLTLVRRKNILDERGFLSRVFCRDELLSVGWTKPVAQINHTFTNKRGVVRGLHYQKPPHSEMKLVNCLRGEIWDVVIDLRANSPTFMKWHAEVLSKENGCALIIPEGCAHGFQVLSEGAELIYCHSEPYAKASEGGLNALDPLFGIPWPISISERSEKDSLHQFINSTYTGISL